MPNNSYAALFVLYLTCLAACSEPPPPVALPRPVQTSIVHPGTVTQSISLSGQIQASNQANLAFRVGGRLLERLVSTGDAVSSGQLVARIENQDAANALRSAEADLSAAQASLTQAQKNEARVGALVEKALVPRSQYDDAEEQLAAAQSKVNSALANLQAARDSLGYTELQSDMAGTVTETGAEPGEVVSAGQMIVRIAHQGGKDAVFQVPPQLIRETDANPEVTVVLVDDPAIAAIGHVREVSPQADPTTGTHTVKVGLVEPPDTMFLGATVVGTVKKLEDNVIALRSTALTETDGKPAVWVVSPDSRTVSLRNVQVVRYDASEVIISEGLSGGDIIVTAGVHALRPGQEVRILDSPP